MFGTLFRRGQPKSESNGVATSDGQCNEERGEVLFPLSSDRKASESLRPFSGIPTFRTQKPLPENGPLREREREAEREAKR